MTQKQLRKELNQKLSMILMQARADQGKSLDQIASALSMSPSTLQKMELKPATVPICILGKVMEYYGFETTKKASALFLELQQLGSQYRSSRIKKKL